MVVAPRVVIMMWKEVSIVVALASLIFWCEPVHATGTGTVGIGPVATGAQQTGYRREWVELTQRGHLLVGKPERGPVSLITIYAPATKKPGHVILRWLERRDGMTSMLLSAPERLKSRIVRVTIYVPQRGKLWTLYEQASSGWVRHPSHMIRFAASDESGSVDRRLMAFVAAGLGPYWLMRAGGSGSRNGAVVPSQSLIDNGSWVRGLSNWIYPFFLLAGGLVASLCWYRAERRTEG